MSGKTAPSDPDPSMEDILSSIRRILNEDEPAPAPAPDVLVLNESMMVQEPGSTPPGTTPPGTTPLAASMPASGMAAAGMTAAGAAGDAAASAMGGLIAPAAAAAAATSVGELVRTISAERGAAVHRGGPTIEDLVREEIRPLLKAWLDTNLPPLVERLVRAEIERVVGRAAG
jgi:cell pole-organizing protein PopZ